MFFWSGDRPKRKVYRELVSGPIISPNHRAPQSLPSLAHDFDRQFFSDFRRFGEVLNRWFGDEYTASRWRVQERSNAELHIDYFDYPLFGRSYEVFYGATKLGILEVRASQFYQKDRVVIASIEIEWVRLLPWATVAEFPHVVAMYVRSPNNDDSTARIQTALNRALWDSLVVHDQDLGLDWGQLELSLEGNAEFYFHSSK
jgi:hypothetical protein